MIRKYVRTPQLDFVMPPCPTHPAPLTQIFALFASLTAFLHAITRPRHDEIRQSPSSPQFPAIRRPLYTCVSYGPATTTLQIRHLSDTNRIFSDTKSVELSNVLLSGPTTPPAPDSRPASRRNPPTMSRPRNLPSCDSIVSYGPDTTMRRMRRLSDTKKIVSAMESVARPIWRATAYNSNSRPIRPIGATKHSQVCNDYRHFGHRQHSIHGRYARRTLVDNPRPLEDRASVLNLTPVTNSSKVPIDNLNGDPLIQRGRGNGPAKPGNRPAPPSAERCQVRPRLKTGERWGRINEFIASPSEKLFSCPRPVARYLLNVRNRSNNLRQRQTGTPRPDPSTNRGPCRLDR